MPGGGDGCNGILPEQTDANDLNSTFSIPKGEDNPSSLHNSYSPTSASSLVGSYQGMTTEERMRRVQEVKAHKEEQRRLQVLESQHLHEVQVAKQAEERKRKIDETRKREEARAQLAQERRKEFDRQRQESKQNIVDRSHDRAPSSDPVLRLINQQQMNGLIPANMRTSQTAHLDDKCELNGCRMTSSFTVAFGSSVPRPTCTTLSAAALRAQAAFEARLSAYLNGRHSGCFLTSNSPYTKYALYVNPSLLPENHPIRNLKNHALLQHQPSCHDHCSRSCSRVEKAVDSRRTTSANSPDIIAGRTGAALKMPIVDASPQTGVMSGDHFRECSKGEVGEQTSRNPRIKNSADKTDRLEDKEKGETQTKKPIAQRRETPMRSKYPKNRCNSFGELTVPLPSKAHSQTKTEHSVVVIKEEIANPINDTVKPISVSRTTGSSLQPTGPEGSQITAQRRKPGETELKTEVDRPTIPESKSTALPSSDAAPTLSSFESPRPTLQQLQVNLEHMEGHEPVVDCRPNPTDIVESENISCEERNETASILQPSPDFSLKSNQTADNSYSLQKSKTKKNSKEGKSPKLPNKNETPTSVKDSLALSDTATEHSDCVSVPATTEAGLPQRMPSPLMPSTVAISASTTSSGEGGQLSEDEASRYRAKMAEQRRLARERKIEEQRRAAEEELKRREEFELARKAAQERALEEANRAREARLAAEAQAAMKQYLPEKSSSLLSGEQCASHTDDKTNKDRERLEALERDRHESFQRAEEERAERKRRLESIMSRVKGGSGQGFSRTSTANSSTTSLNALAAEQSRSCSVPRVPLDSAAQFTIGDDQCESSVAGISETLEGKCNASGRLGQNDFNLPQAFTRDVVNHHEISKVELDGATNGHFACGDEHHDSHIGLDISDAIPRDQHYQLFTPLDLKSPGVQPVVGSGSH